MLDEVKADGMRNPKGHGCAIGGASGARQHAGRCCLERSPGCVAAYHGGGRKGGARVE